MHFFVFLVQGVLGIQCPPYQCSQLEDHLCAQWVKGAVYLNTDACPEGLSCSLHELQRVIKAEQEALSWGVVPCVNASSYWVDPEYVNSGNYRCWLRDGDAKLIRGSHPRECNEVGDNDYACKLTNGGFAACKCGLNGKAYCDLSDADAEMKLFWEWCEVFRVPESVRDFWKLYKTYYIETMVRLT
jgi:hypothetical protein